MTTTLLAVDDSKTMRKVIEITFAGEGDTLNYFYFFLSSTSQGYVLRALGKNGEPKPHVAFKLEATSRLFHGSIANTYRTDSNGEISLGNLNNVRTLNASTVAANPADSTGAFWDIDTVLR